MALLLNMQDRKTVASKTRLNFISALADIDVVKLFISLEVNP
jgi:hypothetical protein